MASCPLQASDMNLGIPPSQLSWFQRLTLRLITRPSWMRRHGASGLNRFLAAEPDLKKNGIVVPGTIVQANNLLFQPGKWDHPGELLFSLSQTLDGAALRNLARELYCLKGERRRDPEEAFFSDHLANEMTRVVGAKVPKRLCPAEDTYVSTAIFYRAHLPGGVIQPSIYPVLVSPNSLVAMILPVKYWTAEGWDNYKKFC